MTCFWCVLLGIAIPIVSLVAVSLYYAMQKPTKSQNPIPCPYCPNPNRDDNGNAIGGSRTGNCQWVEDKTSSKGADAPCVCDHYGTARADR